MNSPNYAYFLGPKKISSSSNYLESLNAQRNVKRRNTEKQFGQQNHPKAQNEENSGSKARFIRRNECSQKEQNNQDMPSANIFNNRTRTRNYPITHMYTLSSKKESNQKKKEKAKVNINATKLKSGLCDLISDNGSSKAKNHKDNISYSSNISNNRAKIESDYVKRIIEKIANDAVGKIAKQNASFLDSLNSLLSKYFKKQ